MTGRELAWRVLAHELRASSEEERGTGEKSPSYVISPLGARMNRVVVAGRISSGERMGADPAAGFWRARLTDPTGSLTVTAGSFQPAAQAELQGISAPTPAFVVGKLALFRGAGGPPTASLRAEAIRPIPDVEYRTLVAEAATQTLERLELVLRLRTASPPTDEELARANISPSWVRGARASLTHYPSLDPAPYLETLRAVLVALRGAPSEDAATIPAAPALVPSPEVVRTTHSRVPASPPAPPVGFQALQGRLLEILDELADESPDGYADMDELAERAARHGIDGERMEEILNYLSENGTLEEPLVGKFRRAEGPPRE